MSKGRTKLEQFPCPRWGDPYQMHCCEEGAWCPPTCEYKDVYLQAIADHECARLLRVFEKRWTGPIMSYVTRHVRVWSHGRNKLCPFLSALIEFRSVISAALRKAGL